MLGAGGDADGHGDLHPLAQGARVQVLLEAAGQAEAVAGMAGGHDDGELLAAHTADDVAGAHERGERFRQGHQHLVSCCVTVDVVDPLEVVHVDHEHRHRVPHPARSGQLRPQPLVEDAVVVEAGERVGLSLVLEPGPHLGVIDGQRGGVPEARGQLELVLLEAGAFAHPVDAERSLQRPAGHQGHRDQGLGLRRRPRDEGHPRVEVGLVGEDRTPVRRRPAGDALPEAGPGAHDLLRPLAANEYGHELAAGEIGLVHVQRVVGDKLGQGVGDAVEQGVEGLLGQDEVEDLGQAAVGVDQRAPARSAAPRGRPGRGARDIGGHTAPIGRRLGSLEAGQGC